MACGVQWHVSAFPANLMQRCNSHHFFEQQEPVNFLHGRETSARIFFVWSSVSYHFYRTCLNGSLHMHNLHFLNNFACSLFLQLLKYLFKGLRLYKCLLYCILDKHVFWGNKPSPTKQHIVQANFIFGRLKYAKQRALLLPRSSNNTLVHLILASKTAYFKMRAKPWSHVCLFLAQYRYSCWQLAKCKLLLMIRCMLPAGVLTST